MVQPHQYPFWKDQEEPPAPPLGGQVRFWRSPSNWKNFMPAWNAGWSQVRVQGHRLEKGSCFIIPANVNKFNGCISSPPNPLTICKWAGFKSPAFSHGKSSSKRPPPNPKDPKHCTWPTHATGTGGGTYSQSGLEEQSSRQVSKPQLASQHVLGTGQPWEWAGAAGVTQGIQ